MVGRVLNASTMDSAASTMDSAASRTITLKSITMDLITPADGGIVR